MDQKQHDTIAGGQGTVFGYYPAQCDISARRFSICTLHDIESKVARVENDPNVVRNWIYPGAQPHRDFMSGATHSLPYSARIFGLPKTHALTLNGCESPDDIDFVVWCLSFFTGMRLTTTEAGFLDSTPIKPGMLVDFLLAGTSLEDTIKIALDYLESERGNSPALKRVAAVIHALFLAQYPQNLPFEEFQYLYMALDACFRLMWEKEPVKNKNPKHGQRIGWMCEKLGIAVPQWADNASGTVPTIRNDAFHEALFFGEPLGFAVYGGSQVSPDNANVMLQMHALVCRLLVGILASPAVPYVHTSIDARQRYGLEFSKVSGQVSAG